MDDIERAVLCSVDPTATQELKMSASQFLQQYQEQPNSWKMCFQRFVNQSVKLQVRFWCLEAIGSYIKKKYETLAPADSAILRQMFLAYMKQYAAKDSTQQLENSAILNKFTTAFVFLVEKEYPTGIWNNCFRDVLSLLQSCQGSERIVDLFLRIFNSLHQEYINKHMTAIKGFDKHASDLIKDKIRVDCAKDICQAWATILRFEHPALTDMCLSVMKDYIDWFDISYFVGSGSPFIQLLFKFFSNPSFKTNACECVYMIISKGMPQKAKLQLFTTINITEFLPTVQINSGKESEFVQAFSKMVNVVATQLLEFLDKFPMDTPEYAVSVQEFNKSIPITFRLLGDEDTQVSDKIIQFILDFVNFIKKKKDKKMLLSPVETQSLAQLLTIAKRKMTYPSNFEFDPKEQTEIEILFAEHRERLFILFRNLCKIEPDMGKEFLRGQMLALFNSPTLLDLANYREIEVQLMLFFHIGDALSQELYKSAFFCEILQLIIEKQISKHPHPIVLLAYFDVLYRYAKLFLQISKYIPDILQSFVDGRGIRSQNSMVSSKANEKFVSFVRDLKSQLHPFIVQLTQHTKDLLILTPANLEIFPERLAIFESLGYILSNQKIDSNTRMSVFKELIFPTLKQMEEILERKLYLSDTDKKPTYSKLLSLQISSISHLSKGFSVSEEDLKKAAQNAPSLQNGAPQQQQQPQTQLSSSKNTLEELQIFKKIITLFMQVFSVLPNNKTIHQNFIFYMHRMIELLDFLQQENMLLFGQVLKLLFGHIETLSAPQQQQNSPAQTIFNVVLSPQQRTEIANYQLNEFLSLVQQLISKHKGAVFSLIDTMLTPIFMRVLAQTKVFVVSGQTNATSSFSSNSNMTEVWNTSTDGVMSEESRMELTVYNTFLKLLLAIVTKNCDEVFISQGNLPKMELILDFIRKGFFHPLNSTIRLAFNLMNEIVALWLSGGGKKVPQFDVYVMERVVPSVFKSLMNNQEFDIEEGTWNQIAQESLDIFQSIIKNANHENQLVAKFSQFLMAQLKMSAQEANDFLSEISKLIATKQVPLHIKYKTSKEKFNLIIKRGLQ